MKTPGARPRPSAAEVATFRALVLRHYCEHGRDFPWRRTWDPYHILVSEFMLQQTQVSRVVQAYQRFLDVFPSASSVALAPTVQVLREWQGLGYNRRALRLKRVAEIVCERWGGDIPADYEVLLTLPGVGRATAGAVAAFAFGEAHPFVETNIRAALVHHFITDGRGAGEGELLALAEAVMDREDPRTWYYALMDYGAHLKRRYRDPVNRSAPGRRQSPFEGSRRQLRSSVLRAVLDSPGVEVGELQRMGATGKMAAGVVWEPDQVAVVVEALCAEGFISRTPQGLCCPP